MKKLFLIATLFATVLVTGCSDKKHLEFAGKVAEYVKANQLDSLAAVYPGAQFDSIAFAGDYEIVNIEKTDVDGVVRVRFGEIAYIDIKDDENGVMTIVESSGIAAFPQDKLDLAKKTGMVQDTISDIAKAELISDADFFTWLAERQADELSNIISLKGGKAKLAGVYGEGNNLYVIDATLTNNSKNDISADAYSIEYNITYYGEEDNGWRNRYETGNQEGVELKAGESKDIKIKKEHVGKIGNPRIKWNLSPEELGKFLTFTGNEYSEYQKSKEK